MCIHIAAKATASTLVKFTPCVFAIFHISTIRQDIILCTLFDGVENGNL